MTESQARTQVDEIIADRETRLPVREEALRWLGERARAGAVRLLGHDPASAAEIDALVARGGAVAEFPTTVQAATAARDRGLSVVMGAPNVLRGSSHSGNVSAAELASRGLVSALRRTTCPPGCSPLRSCSPSRASPRWRPGCGWSPPARPMRWGWPTGGGCWRGSGPT